MDFNKNRKRSGRILTGVVLCSGAISAMDQGVVGAVPQSANSEVTNLLSGKIESLGNQGSNFYKTAGYVFLFGCVFSVLVFLLYKAVVYVRGNVGREELINEKNREEQFVYLEKKEVCERFDGDRYYYDEEIRSLLGQFFEENNSCEYLVYNRETKEFYATDKEGRCPVDKNSGVRRIVKCSGKKVLDFKKDFFKAAGKELQKEDEGAYGEPDLSKCFTDEENVDYSEDVKSLFKFVYKLRGYIRNFDLTVTEGNLKSSMPNNKLPDDLKKIEDKDGKIVVGFCDLGAKNLGAKNENLNGRMYFYKNVDGIFVSTKFLKNDLSAVVGFYNFLLHEAYIQGKMEKNIQFSIGKDKKTVYVEEGISEKIKKIKLDDLMKYEKNDGEAFRNFVFRYEGAQEFN